MVIKQYLELSNKLNKTPSTSDMKRERKSNKDFPTIYWIRKYFETGNNLAKQCGLQQNKRNLELLDINKIKSLRIYLRNFSIKWKNDTVEYWNGLSCISGDKYDVVHHDYSFSDIIDEIFKITGLNKSNNVDNYSKEELSEITKLCEELHYKHGLGYCLTNSEHNELHSIYKYNANGKMKEFIDYKLHNKPIKLDALSDFILNKEIIILKSEFEKIISIPNYSGKKVLLVLLIFSKIFSDVNGEFYAPYSLIQEFNISDGTISKYKKYLVENNLLIERKELDKNIRFVKCIYNVNIFNDYSTNEYVSLNPNRDLNLIIFYCLNSFYKDKKIIKNLIPDYHYRNYLKYIKDNKDIV